MEGSSKQQEMKMESVQRPHTLLNRVWGEGQCSQGEARTSLQQPIVSVISFLLWDSPQEGYNQFTTWSSASSPTQVHRTQTGCTFNLSIKS